jgi:hypothetical protein
MINNNRKIKTNKGMSRDMYDHIISNVHRFKSIDIEKGIIDLCTHASAKSGCNFPSEYLGLEP